MKFSLTRSCAKSKILDSQDNNNVLLDTKILHRNVFSILPFVFRNNYVVFRNTRSTFGNDPRRTAVPVVVKLDRRSQYSIVKISNTTYVHSLLHLRSLFLTSLIQFSLLFNSFVHFNIRISLAILSHRSESFSVSTNGHIQSKSLRIGRISTLQIEHVKYLGKSWYFIDIDLIDKILRHVLCCSKEDSIFRDFPKCEEKLRKRKTKR